MNIDVEYVELDMKVNSTLSSEDFVNESWGLQASSSLTSDLILDTGNMDNASVVVAIIDSGCDLEHPLLKDKFFINTVELDGEEGVDDDNNGIK